MMQVVCKVHYDMTYVQVIVILQNICGTDRKSLSLSLSLYIYIYIIVEIHSLPYVTARRWSKQRVFERPVKMRDFAAPGVGRARDGGGGRGDGGPDTEPQDGEHYIYIYIYILYIYVMLYILYVCI
jgi:hypothetical protein